MKPLGGFGYRLLCHLRAVNPSSSLATAVGLINRRGQYVLRAVWSMDPARGRGHARAAVAWWCRGMEANGHGPTRLGARFLMSVDRSQPKREQSRTRGIICENETG
jgi:hypothetical protein